MKKLVFCVIMATVLATGAVAETASAATRSSSGASDAPATSAVQSEAAPKKKTLEGILRLLATDTVEELATPDSHEVRGSAEDHVSPVLIVGDRTYFLKGKKAEHLQPNRRVRVVGLESGGNVETESVTDLGAAAGMVPTSGTTRILVMLAHWNIPDGITQASAGTQMFTDSNAWYRDASYGALGQTGDVTPWMRITGPANGQCRADHLSTMTQAKNAATALGYNLANYDNYVLYSPNNRWQVGSDCDDAAGWAYVGAQDTWLNGYMDRRVTVHELGHNYGLWHANSYMCSGGGTSGTCGFEEYGDDFDAMGSSRLVGHFSAPAKYALGWMGGRAVDLSTGGTATLAPLASDALAVSAAIVRVSPSRTYWVEYRQAIDQDSSIPVYGTDGVMIRMLDSNVNGGRGTHLLDVVTADGIDVSSATLGAGQSWTSAEGYRFTTNSASTTGATISVVAGSPRVCADAAYEPDDTAAQARDFPVGSTQNRELCGPNDQDWVKFTATAGTSYRLETLNLANGVDTHLVVHTDPSSQIASNNDSNGTLASHIDFRPTTSGTYFVRVVEAYGREGEDFTYDMRITSSDTGDTTPPTVTSKVPAANATGVSGTANITVTFSEAVNGVGPTTLTVSDQTTGAVLPATVYRNGTTNQWILDPAVTLTAGTLYIAMVTGGWGQVRDLAGNPHANYTWKFTAGAPPAVTTRTPATNATNASRTANITATFDKAVTGVSTSTFTLRKTATDTPVTGVVTRNGTTNQWILNPSVTLANDTWYTVKLTGGPAAIRDTSGNPLTTHGSSFLTGPGPTVTTKAPASGATTASRTANITATFSEAVTGVSGTTFVMKNATTGGTAAATVTRNGTTNQWILNPTVTLPARTRYTVTLTGGATAIRDIAGNPLTNTTWSFTTGS